MCTSHKASVGNSVFVIVFGCFSPIINLLGQTEMRTRERNEWQSIRTVWDISRDDRVRIATCSLQQWQIDRFKENSNIDDWLQGAEFVTIKRLPNMSHHQLLSFIPGLVQHTPGYVVITGWSYGDDTCHHQAPDGPGLCGWIYHKAIHQHSAQYSNNLSSWINVYLFSIHAWSEQV